MKNLAVHMTEEMYHYGYTCGQRNVLNFEIVIEFEIDYLFNKTNSFATTSVI